MPSSRILLVEDEPELLQALSVRLTAAGFTCEMAGNGKEALAKLQGWRPDLIVADLAMPVMDGHDFIRHLKAEKHTASIPVLVLTAVPGHSREQGTRDLKVAGVMQKPFDSGDLLVTIRELLAGAASGGPRHG